jgi:ankyrin
MRYKHRREMDAFLSHRLAALCSLVLVLVSGCATLPEERMRQAIADGDLARVKALLDQGIGVHTADERGVTPLFLAARDGHRDIAAFLLAKGASPTQARQDGVTPLVAAVQHGHANVVALFLEQGAEVNARGKIGEVTLLHIGAYRGHREIVTLLLKYGGDKNARMSSGERPVDLARQQGHTALIPLLEP